MKTFFIFAVLCIQNSDLEQGISCFNYWEDSKKYVAKDCYERAQNIGDEIKAKFRQENIEIMEHIVWCIDRKDKPI
jgi:hypothetical protein